MSRTALLLFACFAAGCGHRNVTVHAGAETLLPLKVVVIPVRTCLYVNVTNAEKNNDGG